MHWVRPFNTHSMNIYQRKHDYNYYSTNIHWPVTKWDRMQKKYKYEEQNCNLLKIKYEKRAKNM